MSAQVVLVAGSRGQVAAIRALLEQGGWHGPVVQDRDEYRRLLPLSSRAEDQ